MTAGRSTVLIFFNERHHMVLVSLSNMLVRTFCVQQLKVQSKIKYTILRLLGVSGYHMIRVRTHRTLTEAKLPTGQVKFVQWS